MDQLIVGALEEGGVDRHHRLQAFAGHAGSQGDCVLLGDGDVEVAVRIAFAERHQVGAFLHRRGDAGQARVGGGHVAQPLAEDVGVFRPRGLLRRWRRADRLQLADRMPGDGVGLGRGEALALLRHHMEELRAVEVAHVAQGGDQGRQVVAVDGADVVPAQFLEQGAGHQHALGVFLGAAGDFPGAWQAREDLLAAFAHARIGAAGEDLGQVVGQAADVARDRHVVVVEHHQHVGADFRGVVERLEGHAGGQRTVTDHRDGLALFAFQTRGDRHAQGGADRGAGMTDAEGVVLALDPARKGGQAVLLAQGAHALAAAGEDLVRIGLVAHVPDQPVVRCVVDVVQGDGQFDHAEAGAEVPAGAADAVQQLLAQFVGKLFEFRLAQSAQLLGGRRSVKNGRRGAHPRNLMERLGHQADRCR